MFVCEGLLFLPQGLIHLLFWIFLCEYIKYTCRTWITNSHLFCFYIRTWLMHWKHRTVNYAPCSSRHPIPENIPISIQIRNRKEMMWSVGLNLKIKIFYSYFRWSTSIVHFRIHIRLLNTNRYTQKLLIFDSYIEIRHL